jgi:2-deoxy-D-gluconate 3-dehydrogenase
MTSPIQMIVERAFREFGKIDILVNNAGIIRRTPAIEFSEKDWDEVMAINSKTVFFFPQAVAKDMMKQKYGKIINISSLLAFQGGILVPSYAASKGAVAQVKMSVTGFWQELLRLASAAIFLTKKQ